MNRYRRLYNDICHKLFDPQGILLKYYSAEPNVGDVLNTYMIPKITGRSVHKSYTHKFEHLMAIGSLLEGAGPRSVIWGSGSINGTGPIRPVTAARICALRGKKSLALMEKACGTSLDVPLGDPALLMPMFYDPAVETDKEIGIVPHHSEKDLSRQLGKLITDDHLIIDVALDPETFIQQMKRCNVVMSSSLHGLILADAYGIPSKWISISDRLKGGDWKFGDYYSVTSTPMESPYRTPSVDSLMDHLETLSRAAEISRYTGSREQLLKSFPASFMESNRRG